MRMRQSATTRDVLPAWECGSVRNSRVSVRQPLLWRERGGGYRRVNIPGFPYYVAYIIRGERVLVTAVGHASRHPDYWKRRGF